MRLTYKQFKTFLKEEYIISDLLEENKILLKNNIPSIIQNLYNDVINSKQFKDWYSNSKLIDANGNPIIWYHGTTANFNEFSEKFLDKNTSIATNYFGFYFTTSPQTASIYVSKKFDVNAGFKKYAKIKAYFLNVKNPYYLSQKRYWKWGNLNDVEAVDLLQMLQSRNYDALIMDSVWRGSIYNSVDICVFNNKQIKQIAEFEPYKI